MYESECDLRLTDDSEYDLYMTNVFVSLNQHKAYIYIYIYNYLNLIM